MKSKRIVSIFMFTMFFGSKVGAQGEAPESLPMWIGVDQSKLELGTQKIAITLNLFLGILLNEAPLLVTKSVLYNFLEYKEFWEGASLTGEIPLKPFDGKSGWRIYDVNKGLFFLLVPSPFLEQHKDNNGLNLDQNGKSQDPTLQDITEMFKRKDYLISLKAMSEVQGDFKVEDLKSVFRKRVLPGEKVPWLKVLESQKSWNIILDGHGTINVSVADLERNQLKDFLSFLNSYINTTLLYVTSCYVGGVNRIHFKEIAGEQLGSSLNYLTVVQGITDAPSFSAFGGKAPRNLLDVIFSAAQGTDKGMGLNKFLKEVNVGLENEELLHKTAHIPQVLLPGGMEFQTFNVDKKVLSLGYVFVEKHRLENKPIEAKGKDAVLIYPRAIYPELKVETTELPERGYPVLSSMELVAEMKEKHKEQIEAHIENFPAYRAYEKLQTPVLERIYPEFIPMNLSLVRWKPEELNIDVKRHWFKKIRLVDRETQAETALRGIMQFIRDSFTPLSGFKESLSGFKEIRVEEFFIDELVGENDLSIIMEYFRAENKKYDERIMLTADNESMEAVLADYIKETISLEKVYIGRKAEGSIKDPEQHVTIAFILPLIKEGSSSTLKFGVKMEMRLKAEGQSFWDKIEWLDPDKYERNYNSLVEALKKGVPSAEIEQKTLPEILKQKQERGSIEIEKAKTKSPSESKQMPKAEISQLLKGPRNQKWAGKVSGNKQSYQKNRSSLLNIRCQNTRNSYWFKKSSKGAGAFDEKIV